MKRKLQFIVMIAATFIASCVITVLVALGTLNFPSPADRSTLALVAIGLWGLGFLATVLSQASRLSIYGKDLGLSQIIEDEFILDLKRLGALPLKSFLVFILTTTLAQGVLGLLQSRLWGCGGFGVTMIQIFTFAINALIGAFIYIYLDNLNMIILKEKAITLYPSGLREDRQRKKNLIIPMVMVVMTSSFTFAVSAFVVARLEGLDETRGFQLLSSMSAVLLPSLGLYLGLCLIMTLIWTRNTERLYKHVLGRLDQIASADKDLTGRIDILSIDEIASMEGRINAFTDMLKGSFTEVKEAFDMSSQLQRKLFEAISRSSKNSHEIGEAVETMLDMVKREDEKVATASASGREVTGNVQRVIQQVKLQNESVQDSARDTERSIEAVSQAAKRTMEVKDRTERLIAAFKESDRDINSTLASVNAIVELSKKLSELNALIAKIASQTNLLAMNAAIEAAHAGDSGRGFSVVADEIRNLAETTARHTKDSRESLKSILAEIQRALDVSQKTAGSYHGMSGLLEEVGDGNRAIAESMEGQDRANKSVLERLKETQGLSAETEKIAGELEKETSDLIRDLGDLGEISKLALLNIEMTKARNEEEKAAIKEVDELANKAVHLSAKSEALISDFKL